MAITNLLGGPDSMLGNLQLGIPPAPPVPPEPTFGPPTRLANLLRFPWVQKAPFRPVARQQEVPPPPTPDQTNAAQTYQQPFRIGQLLKFPWTHRIQPLPFLDNRGTAPPTPPSPRVPSKSKPFLARVPVTEGPAADDRRRRFTELLTICYNSLLRQGYIQETGQTDFAIRGGAFTATRDPATADDLSQGAFVGAFWVNTTSGTGFLCVSAAANAANWKQVT